MSPHSLHQAAGMISGALAWACQRGDLAHNPAIGARLPDGTQRGPAHHRS